MKVTKVFTIEQFLNREGVTWALGEAKYKMHYSPGVIYFR